MLECQKRVERMLRCEGPGCLGERELPGRQHYSLNGNSHRSELEVKRFWDLIGCRLREHLQKRDIPLGPVEDSLEFLEVLAELRVRRTLEVVRK